MPTSLSDAVHQTERALLGSILLDSSLWLQIDSLGAQDFGLEAHRRIYGRMAAMFEDQRPVDIVTLTLELAQLDQLASCGDAGYLASLLEHAFPENFSAYVRTVRESSRDRRYSHLLESLSRSAKTDDRLAKLEQMQALLREESLDTEGALYPERDANHAHGGSWRRKEFHCPGYNRRCRASWRQNGVSHN
jgi:replicative DNA helicase